MNQRITCPVSGFEGKVRMLGRKAGKMTLDVACRLADDLQVADNRILLLFVEQKRGMVNIGQVVSSLEVISWVTTSRQWAIIRYYIDV